MRHFLPLLISNKETEKNAANTAHGESARERGGISEKNERLEEAHGTHELLQPVKQAAKKNRYKEESPQSWASSYSSERKVEF